MLIAISRNTLPQFREEFSLLNSTPVTAYQVLLLTAFTFAAVQRGVQFIEQYSSSSVSSAAVNCFFHWKDDDNTKLLKTAKKIYEPHLINYYDLR